MPNEARISTALQQLKFISFSPQWCGEITSNVAKELPYDQARLHFTIPDPEEFFRISRSAIVNLDRVKELQPMLKGEHVIVLQNGKRVKDGDENVLGICENL